MTTIRLFRRAATPALLVFLAAACGTSKDIIGSTGGTVTFSNTPCTPASTISLAVNTATRVDCSAIGSTITLAGAGANYLIIPQFATDQVGLSLVPYSLATGKLAAAAAAAGSDRARLHGSGMTAMMALDGSRRPMRPPFAQMAADRWLRARGRRFAASGAMHSAYMRSLATSAAAGPKPVPPAGSLSNFKVLANFSSGTFATVTAKLVYVGNNVLLYIDTLAPANGFTPSQLQLFGGRFDSTLYDIDTTTFGSPSDIDNNQRFIMLMSPTVNGDTPTSTCQTEGFVAGFFNEEDFNPVASDPNSNGGEIFYSIVPDTNAVFSCSHGVGGVSESVQPTFMHELQHLINFSQHVVVNGINPLDSWLDEGLSIVAEEQGSLYWEAQCPFPQASCRTTDPSALFPDSSQGFIQNLFFDSYAYAVVPDTSSLTDHDDSEGGFSWRGGAWLFSRYLGDQFGTSIFKKIVKGPSSALSNVALESGQPFPTLFQNFGIALYTDSFPGLPRNTAPSANRFVTRNMHTLWARLFVTSGPSAEVPAAMPIVPFEVSNDTTSIVMQPGTMSFWRLDTPTSDTTVTIRFSSPGGVTFPANLVAQVAIYRLPAGQ
ncbi:MAG TPA: hypothetical protein VGI92_13295 [Gemmatimonadales bacterium]|jgi:hypothetical protein